MNVSLAEKPAKWSSILQQLQLSAKMDFYEMLYKPLVQERIKTIVKSSWTAAIVQTEKDILKVLDSDDVNWTSKDSTASHLYVKLILLFVSSFSSGKIILG